MLALRCVRMESTGTSQPWMPLLGNGPTIHYSIIFKHNSTFLPPHHFPSLSPWEFVPVVLRKAGSWQQQLRLCHSIWVPASPVTTLTPAGISDMGNVRSICWGASSAGFCRGSSHRLTALWIFQSCFIREPDSSGDRCCHLSFSWA